MAKKKGGDDKGKKVEETALTSTDSSEGLLEAELKRVEEKYKETRQRVNDLRKQHDDVKQKTINMHQEAREFAHYIEQKRTKRHEQVVTIHDDQERHLRELDEEEEKLQKEHQAEIEKINGLVRDEEFKRIKLHDELQQQAEVVLLKDKNDRQIEELNAKYAKMQVDDAENLQAMKIEWLDKQRDFIASAVATSKDEIQNLQVEAKKMVIERTLSAKKQNQDLRSRLVELIQEGKSLAKQKRSIEDQQRNVRAEIDYLKSIKRTEA